LPNSDAALQEEGTNLIDYSGALAHAIARVCRNSAKDVVGKKYFSVLQPDWSIAVGESQPFSSFRKSLFFPWLSMAKRTKRNGSKNEGEGLQEAHPGRQKVGQACGWQEVEENCKDVSREETMEARDQPERRKPTHKKRRQRLKLRLLTWSMSRSRVLCA